MGLARSRSEAKRAIDEHRVKVAGIPTPTPATMVDPGIGITLVSPSRFVSRGGDKLNDALSELDVAVEGRLWMDAGASTGGFTDRLLQGGAERVVAVDVGYGQFDWGLRNDPRVVLIERTNVRHLTPEQLPFVPTGVVADLSFISLAMVLPALVRCAAITADHLLLVKPQFEVGKDLLGERGVVREPALWRKAIEGVVGAGSDLGLGLIAAVPSRWPGPAGNIEFFVHLRKGEDSDMGAIDQALQAVGS